MKFKDRLRYWLYLALLYPLALMPLWMLYGVSDFLYILLYKVFKYRIHVVRTNLKACFPDMSEKELKDTERKFYHHLCDVFVETVKLLRVSEKTIMKRVEMVNPEIVREIGDRKKPIILYLGHYCNWEWVTLITEYFDRSKIWGGHIYRDQKDEAANKLLYKMRSRFPSNGINLKSAVRDILRINKEYDSLMVGFISDHRFNSAQHKESTTFLGQETPYYVGGEAIGTKIGAEYLYLDVERTGRGRFRFTYIPVTPDDDGPHPITRKYMKLMEATIRRQPPYWLWSHKRWPALFKKQNIENQSKPT